MDLQGIAMPNPSSTLSLHFANEIKYGIICGNKTTGDMTT